MKKPRDNQPVNDSKADKNAELKKTKEELEAEAKKIGEAKTREMQKAMALDSTPVGLTVRKR